MSATSTTTVKRSDQVIGQLVDRFITHFNESSTDSIIMKIFKTNGAEPPKIRVVLMPIFSCNYPDLMKVIACLGDLGAPDLEEFPEEDDLDWPIIWANYAGELHEYLKEQVELLEKETAPVKLFESESAVSIDPLELEQEFKGLGTGRVKTIWARLDQLNSQDLHAANMGPVIVQYYCSPKFEWKCYQRCIAKVYPKDLADLCLELGFVGFKMEELMEKVHHEGKAQLHPFSMGFGSIKLDDYCLYRANSSDKCSIKITKAKVRPAYTRFQIDMILPEYLMDFFISKYAADVEYVLYHRDLDTGNWLEKTFKQEENSLYPQRT